MKKEKTFIKTLCRKGIEYGIEYGEDFDIKYMLCLLERGITKGYAIRTTLNSAVSTSTIAKDFLPTSLLIDKVFDYESSIEKSFLIKTLSDKKIWEKIFSLDLESLGAAIDKEKEEK